MTVLHIFVRGDVDQLRRLCDSKVNPDVGEHDSRTAMHQVVVVKNVDYNFR